MGRGDVQAAASLLERAVALLAAEDPARPSLLTELGSVQLRAGNFTGAEATLGRAAAAAERRGDRRAGLRAALELEFLASFTAPAEAREVAAAEHLMPELEAVGDHLGLAKAWWLRSEGDALACRWSARAVALEQALAHAQRAADAHDEVGTITALLAQALYYGPTPADEAITRCEELLRGAGGDRPLRAALTSTLAGLYAMRGDLELGRSSFADAVAVYDELGLRFRRAARAHIGAQIALLGDEPAEAERELRTALDTLAEIGARGVHTTLGAVLADILSELGRDDEAEELAREVAGAVAQDDLAPQVLWRVALARVHAHRGEVVEAETLAGEALDLTATVDFPDLRARALTAAAEVTGDSQLLDQACDVYEAKGNTAAAARVRTLRSDAGVVTQPPAE
jgi:tetratricopeptide (TPR) repeat protein